MAKKKTTKTKTKATPKASALDFFQDAAQYVTIVSAVLFGIIWAFQELIDIDVDKFNGVSSGLVITTMIGGVTMGLLYLLDQTKN